MLSRNPFNSPESPKANALAGGCVAVLGNLQAQKEKGPIASTISPFKVQLCLGKTTQLVGVIKQRSKAAQSEVHQGTMRLFDRHRQELQT